MNRGARHELAEREFVRRHVRPPTGWVRASTKAPFDLVLFQPDGGRLHPIFIEVKTARARVESDLSPAESHFAQFAERHGSPYVVARYRVVGRRVEAEHLFRPFSTQGQVGAQSEVALEVSTA